MYTSTKFSKFLFYIIGLIALSTLIYTSSVFVVRARERQLNAPTGLRVTATTDTTISIAWESVSGATHYYVDKWQPSYPNWVNVKIVTNTNYTDTTLNCSDPNKSYGDYYRVRAWDGSTMSEPTGWKLGSPLNDAFSNASSVSAVPDTETLNTCNANRTIYADDPEVTQCGMNEGLSTVWYTYTEGSSGGAISFDTRGADYDTFIAVWTGNETDYQNGTLTPVACNNDTGGTLQSAVAFQTTARETYYIEVGQYAGTTGTSAASVVDTNLGPPESERAK